MSSWTLYLAIAHEGDKDSLREAFKYFIFNVFGAGFIFVGLCVVGPFTPFNATLLTGAAPHMLKKLSVRSPWLFRINAGSCNGCDVELATTACIPRYDVERLGCRYCGSPRHADIVLVTGPLTTRVRDRVLRVWNEIPEPKVTVAVGICPISGGVFREGYSIEGPLDRYIPVDVNVPGCPPRPQAILEAVVLARSIWLKKLGVEE